MKYFLLFTGYPRSAHTITAAILNANPNVYCSNQLNLLNNFQQYKSREDLFNYIKNYSIRPETWKSTTQIPHVPKQDIIIIGDKTAHRTTVSLGENPQLLGEFKQFIQLPIKWIHVVRHTGNNLSTWARLNHENKKKNGKNTTVKKELDNVIRKYNSLNETIVKLKRSEDILTVYHEDIIQKMHNTLEEMCDFLEISFDPKWRDFVRENVWKKPRQTMSRIPWTPTQKAHVNGIIQRYPWLKRYNKVTSGCGRCN